VFPFGSASVLCRPAPNVSSAAMLNPEWPVSDSTYPQASKHFNEFTLDFGPLPLSASKCIQLEELFLLLFQLINLSFVLV